MSVSYWMLYGIGIETGQLRPYVDEEKLWRMVEEQLPEFEVDILKGKAPNHTGVDWILDDELFESPTDAFLFCDDTDTLSVGVDGEGNQYLFYPPSMPWERRENEPQSIEEVHTRIVDVVSRITNLSREKIDGLIDDDMQVLGYG